MYLTHITQYLDVTVRKNPERVAVYDGNCVISFEQLYERVLATAWRISQRLGGKTGQIIAVYLPKSMETVIADLAILYSGNSYMNLDVKSPKQRINNIIKQTNPSLFIVNSDKIVDFPEVKDSIYVLYKGMTDSISEKDRQIVIKLRNLCIDTDLLCVINTSGSTGTPKAVALTHRSFIDFTEVAIETGLIGDAEVCASLVPPFFDLFSFELCMLMAKGSTLVIIPKVLAAFPVRLLELMATHRTTFLFWVPTIMVNIANMDLLSQIALPELKMVWFAGEVFPTAKFNYWRRMLPQATFVNLYGPTEITVICTYHIVKRQLSDSEPIPIGKPFRNTSLLVLNENDQPVNPGEEGELCVRGSSLALGYYNNSEKTSEVFVQNPLQTSYPEILYRTGDIVAMNEHGELVLRGRKDSLIKHSGYRIELGEIEHIAVNVLKIIDNGCVLYDNEQKRIVMVYESHIQISEKELRQSLEKELPHYMVPTIYKRVPQLPRNANGKIDRLELKKIVFKNGKED